MKKILDRLMARQQRLMDQLDAKPIDLRDVKPAESAEVQIAQKKREEDALATALEHLARGDVLLAKSLLLPFDPHASLVRTLTTLSRIYAAEGDFDAAVQLLKRAEAIDPTDKKVWRLLAEACSVRGLHAEEVHYRRRLAFVDAKAPAEAYVDLVRALYRSSPSNTERARPEVELASNKLLASPGLSNDIRVRFAQAQYVFEGMAKDARMHYAAAAPCKADEQDVPARWMRTADWCKRRGLRIQRMVDGGVPSHRPSVAELTDVYVFPRLQWAPVVDDGRVVLSGFMMQRVQFRSEDPGSPLLMNRKSNAELRMPLTPSVIDTPALLVGGMNQYYHNTVEMLSSLAITETLGIGDGLPLVVNEDLGDFQLEQLALLGYNSSRLIRVAANKPVRFSALMVPSRLVRGGRWVDPLLPRWYRSRFVTSSAAGAPSRRLYLSRAGTSRRRVANEDALMVALAAKGFEAVQPETLTVREQIDLFASASHIIGGSGAAMTNMIYAAPGARVITIYNKHFVGGGADLYFDALALSCGHQFSKVLGTPAQVRDGERLIDADIIVDVAAVTAAFD